MPIISNNSLTIDYVNGYQLGNIYLGSTLVQQGNNTPLITNGLVTYYDFQNSLSYNGAYNTIYGLQSPYEKSIYTGSLDNYTTPATASYLVNLGGNIGNALYYPNVNDGNNAIFTPVTGGSGSAVYEDWTFVASIRYDEIPNPPGDSDYAVVWYTQTYNHEMRVNHDDNSMTIVIDSVIIANIPSGSFTLGTWHILQVAVSKASNPQIKWNIDNIYTGSYQYGPSIEMPYSLLRQNWEGVGTDQSAGKGYTQVFGIYNRQLTAGEMAQNFNLLNTRYGI